MIEAVRLSIEQSRDDDRQMMEKRLETATVHRDRIEITLCHDGDTDGQPASPAIVAIPFTPASLPVKGIAHAPSASRRMDEATRKAILTAIIRSKSWIDAIIADPAMDFATIARSEKLAERHVRFLAPLAYLSPRTVEAVAEGRAPTDMAARRLARNLPLRWDEQEHCLAR